MRVMRVTMRVVVTNTRDMNTMMHMRVRGMVTRVTSRIGVILDHSGMILTPRVTLLAALASRRYTPIPP